jgi:hypothetical protein
VNESVADHYEPAVCGSGWALTRTPHEDQDMTATKTRTKFEDTPPPTFDSIARKKMRERTTAYRAFLKQQAEGEQLTESDLGQVADLLEGMGLPDFAWGRDCEAMQRFRVSNAKYRAALDAEPANRERAIELAREAEALQGKLRMLQEELRRTQSAAGKSAAYGQTLAQLQNDHPQALGDIDAAVTLRLEELNRRKAGGMS